MKIILIIAIIFGFNFTFWGLMGLLRLASEFLTKLIYKNGQSKAQHTAQDVCAIIPAYNEELGITKTVASLERILPLEQIFVVNDGSKDGAENILKQLGCKFLSIKNRGKAKALTALIKHFDLVDKYKLLIIVDADSVIDQNYLKYALPFFDNPKIVAVAGYAKTQWNNDGNRIIAHRQKMYRLIQAFFRYGQSWRLFNAINIIPGFCSIYQTWAIKKIKIDAPGLVIEDYNMTFEVQHQKLGLIAHHPKVFGLTQDPDNFRDYVKQIKRWNLGLWQTIRRHGFWLSKFWLVLSVYLFEVITSCVFLLVSPFLLILSVGILIFEQSLGWNGELMILTKYYIFSFLIAYMVDVFLTAIVATLEKRPQILRWGFRAFWLRYIDAWILLRTIPMAFTEKSTGKWESPTRR